MKAHLFRIRNTLLVEYNYLSVDDMNPYLTTTTTFETRDYYLSISRVEIVHYWHLFRTH